MYAYEYPRAAMVTDAVVFRFDGQRLQLLLVERKHDPEKGQWALPGGFMNMDETVEQCCRRELEEETGIRSSKSPDGNIIPYMKQIGTFSDVNRDPRGRVISTAYYVLVKSDFAQAGDDAANVKWISLDRVSGLQNKSRVRPANDLVQDGTVRLAFDHLRILRVALQRLKEDLLFRPVAFELMPEKFTIPDLQRLYEQILGITFDRRNFKKKMEAADILIELGETEECHTHRGGNLYRFDWKKYGLMKNDSLMKREF